MVDGRVKELTQLLQGRGSGQLKYNGESNVIPYQHSSCPFRRTLPNHFIIF